ncbi:hypothetical protein LTR64_004251 [Lithohypha guttulata]|uniref:uncharacterized protein n=1 Tax=Lithohypha guttulata TaxID=1690604 RepID=UPI002DE0A3D3|nr:hypothetical protein LTR51_006454 [Lithohypha guttulata]
MSGFNQNKLDEVVALSDTERKQYLSGPYIKIIHKSPDTDTTRTVVYEQFPEAHAKMLWPGITVADHEPYGKSIVLNLDVTGEGVSEALDWLLRSIANGSNDDMAWKKFNVDHIFTVIHEAAIAMSIENLVSIAETGLGRVATGEQKDASETVDQ